MSRVSTAIASPLHCTARLPVATRTTFVALTWTGIIGLGLATAMASRHSVDADGISYMDMAAAVARGSWSDLVNGYWSPAYPLVLGLILRVGHVPPQWESTAANLLNVCILAMTCAAFHYFIAGILRRRNDREPETIALPAWAVWTVGYALFAHASLDMISTTRQAPDLWLSAFMYLAAGLLVRIRQGDSRLRLSALLGAVLAAGYLVKAVMFMLAPVFILAAVAGLRGRWQDRLAAFAVACAAFALVAGPFVAVLSHAKGRFTYGDTGRINYALHVSAYDPARSWHDREGDNSLFGWQGQVAGLGTPVHPKQVLSTHPLVECFREPIGGSYPFWYDPSYWYEGLQAPRNLHGQLAVLAGNITTLRSMAGEFQITLLAFFALALAAGSAPATRPALQRMWPILLPALAGIGLYAMIVVVPRHVACMLVMLGVTVLCSLRLQSGTRPAWLVPALCMVMTFGLVRPVALACGPAVQSTARELRWRSGDCPREALLVAEGLKKLGIQPGDEVGHIGKALKSWSYWASVARVRIVSELRPTSAFWEADEARQAEIIRVFEAIPGLKALITRDAPREAVDHGWQQIGRTEFYVYLFRRGA